MTDKTNEDKTAPLLVVDDLKTFFFTEDGVVKAVNGLNLTFWKPTGKHPNPDPDLDLLNEDAIDLLELRDIEMASLLVELEDEFNQIRSLF